jgi:hypothetical protein
VPGSPGYAYGPYQFWTIINQPDLNAAVPTTDPAGHPTKVEVYSDNHGEAMVYLNGNWNLNLSAWLVDGAADVSPGATVGSTTVQAMADYPYLRKHEPILSNTVVKTWTWDRQVLGTDSFRYPDGVVTPASRMVLTAGVYTITGGTAPNEVGTSNKKMVFLWLCDRDGWQDGVLGAQVNWSVTGGGNSVTISGITGTGLSNYTGVTNIGLQNGFLANTNGKMTNPDQTRGTSITRAPTKDEQALFKKFYPTLDPTNFAVAGIEILTAGPLADVTVQMKITSPEFGMTPGTPGTIIRNANVDFSASYPMDDQVRVGDANVDGVVNMGDAIAVERMILGLSPKNINADANQDGVVNMADVIKIERMILGLP